MKDIKQSLKKGEVVVGPFSVSASPTLVEIIGYAGYDFVIIDTEHAAAGPYGTETEGLVRAACAADITPLVRVTRNEPGMILKALNFGARGVIIPHVNTREEALRAVQASKYPPVGNRGCAPVIRAARHGALEWRRYVQEANEETLVIPLLEEKAAMDNLEEILSVEGLDIIFFGPYDLAARLGGVGNPEAEALVDKYLEKVVTLCNHKGIPVLNLAWTIELAKKWVNMGCRAIAYSTDISMFNQACWSSMERLRSELKVP